MFGKEIPPVPVLNEAEGRVMVYLAKYRRPAFFTGDDFYAVKV